MVADPHPPGRRSALPALGVLVLVVVGAIAVAALLDDSRSITALRPGDCLLAPETEQITQIDPVDCAEPHELEVVGAVTLTGERYPGDDAVFATGLDACEPVFEEYLGVPYATSRWFLNAFTPSAEGWEAGDRTATCLIFQFDQDLDYVSLTGSARSG